MSMTPDNTSPLSDLQKQGQAFDAAECGIIFGGHGHDRKVVGADSCPLPVGHRGPHHAGRFAWETDATCDCEDCRSFEPDNWCVVFWEREQ